MLNLKLYKSAKLLCHHKNPDVSYSQYNVYFQTPYPYKAQHKKKTKPDNPSKRYLPPSYKNPAKLEEKCCSHGNA